MKNQNYDFLRPNRRVYLEGSPDQYAGGTSNTEADDLSQDLESLDQATRELSDIAASERPDEYAQQLKDEVASLKERLAASKNVASDELRSDVSILRDIIDTELYEANTLDEFLKAPAAELTQRQIDRAIYRLSPYSQAKEKSFPNDKKLQIVSKLAEVVPVDALKLCLEYAFLYPGDLEEDKQLIKNAINIAVPKMTPSDVDAFVARESGLVQANIKANEITYGGPDNPDWQDVRSLAEQQVLDWISDAVN